jgi:hypothetical protein
MTRYTVVWDVDVETALASAWIAGDPTMRSTLTAIANWVDAYLSQDVDDKGESLPEFSARVVTVPLSIAPARVEATFQVFPDDRLVRVTRLVFRGE